MQGNFDLAAQLIGDFSNLQLQLMYQENAQSTPVRIQPNQANSVVIIKNWQGDGKQSLANGSQLYVTGPAYGIKPQTNYIGSVNLVLQNTH